MRALNFTILFLFAGIACYSQPQVGLTLIASGFDNPIDITNAGDDRLFIVEQPGEISIIQSSGTVNSTPFLDITSIVNDGGSEQGLLGMAFHPDYSSNGYFYVHYTNSAGDGQISRFNVSSGDPDIADNLSEFPILTVSQPYSNHNGGCINFGPDNYLYIGLGDGGSAGDPGNRSQDSTELLGKMLRIDVDGGTPYSIPASNPFVGNPGCLDEIWSIGLRNPWKFSFDRSTGDLWIGDVGQNAWEEINFQQAASMGGENFGWRCYEASATYSMSGCSSLSGDYAWPAYEYSQSGAPPNGCSVTGGVVYRGSEFPNLNGHYLFTDFCDSWIYSLYWTGSSWASVNHGTFTGNFSSFGEDYLGEVYIASLYDGKIYKVTDLHNEIDEINETELLNVFPNPVRGVVTIQFNSNSLGGISLRVYNVEGKLFKSLGKVNGGRISIQTGDWAAGYYLIEAMDEFGRTIAAEKLIVE